MKSACKVSRVFLPRKYFQFQEIFRWRSEICIYTRRSHVWGQSGCDVTSLENVIISLKIFKTERFSFFKHFLPKSQHHLQPPQPPLPRNCFSCDQRSTFLCLACHVGAARKSHLHKKDIAPTIKGQRIERGKAKKGSDQPFFGSNWLSNANNLLSMQMIFGKIGTAAD